ncbi:MAG: 2-amino-4-hydroxy-6-hydroxymethyldihydropteridine pyrophosphokinase [Campylobacter sp.]|nr:2-amino-4-hydroxy-6-hydroxymethyldihydropteridine pyrophosphokinase [Campylobacter sp.]MBR2158874.1 2-amino-4-hydroxy-6-hydroxymethyldihydropteridine pyrophosphokinase [Campylobacter sp.]MBR6611909.1 2-amino-4-hydroxy-6-hydroxymethyldihydropteridine pyrophosphokinase [Campylobacter sp.]
MKGKILGYGVISGDDGNRYNFEVSDIVNLDNRDPNKLSGVEVDFEAEEKSAKAIFITHTTPSVNLDNLKNQMMNNDAAGIRFKFLLSIGILLGAELIFLIPFIGLVLGTLLFIGGLALYIVAILALKKESQSTTLLRNLLISFAFIGLFAVLAASFVASLGATFITGVSTVTITLGVFWFLSWVGMSFFWILFMREIAFITGQKVILWGAYVHMVGSILTPVTFGILTIIFSIIALGMYIYGFYKFNAITKREPEQNLPWI